MLPKSVAGILCAGPGVQLLPRLACSWPKDQTTVRVFFVLFFKCCVSSQISAQFQTGLSGSRLCGGTSKCPPLAWGLRYSQIRSRRPSPRPWGPDTPESRLPPPKRPQEQARGKAREQSPLTTNCEAATLPLGGACRHSRGSASPSPSPFRAETTPASRCQLRVKQAGAVHKRRGREQRGCLGLGPTRLHRFGRHVSALAPVPAPDADRPRPPALTRPAAAACYKPRPHRPRSTSHPLPRDWQATSNMAPRGCGPGPTSRSPGEVSRDPAGI